MINIKQNSLFNRDTVLVFALLTMVMMSAIAVSYSVHTTRAKVGELRELSAQFDSLEVEWEKLLLELSTLGGYGRIEAKAVSDLGMVSPSEGQLRVIELK